jgi:hypothetical protein
MLDVASPDTLAPADSPACGVAVAAARGVGPVAGPLVAVPLPAGCDATPSRPVAGALVHADNARPATRTTSRRFARCEIDTGISLSADKGAALTF